MKNQEIAKILYEIAEMLEIKGVQFKPVAYQKAARSVETLSGDIEEVYKKGKLEDIPGVGESIAEKIEEYIKTGKIKYLSDLKDSLSSVFYRGALFFLDRDPLRSRAV